MAENGAGEKQCENCDRIECVMHVASLFGDNEVVGKVVAGELFELSDCRLQSNLKLKVG